MVKTEMVKREAIDMNSLNFMPVDKVPVRVVQSRWAELFAKIPPGQAAVLSESQVNPDSLRGALKRLQKKKRQFMNIAVRSHGPKGKRTVYVLNLGKSTG